MSGLPIPKLPAQDPPIYRPTHGCIDSCHHLTDKEHALLESLESRLFALYDLRMVLWNEYERLRELSDQNTHWINNYKQAIDALVTKAIDRSR